MLILLILEFLLFTHFHEHPSSDKFVNYTMEVGVYWERNSRPFGIWVSKIEKKSNLLEKKKVGDKLTTLFLYYWKMGNLLLGHFLLTRKEIPKSSQFL